jgi:hypothetical protein
MLNPYLIPNYKTKNKFPLLAYNDYLKVNQYKNIIIDLYFLDIPTIIHSSTPLDVL